MSGEKHRSGFTRIATRMNADRRRLRVNQRSHPRNSASTRKGIILLNVVVILLTIALIGASLMTFYFSVDIFARAVADGTKAFYLAEAGIASAVNYLGSESSKLHTPGYEIGPIKLGEGEYKVDIDYTHSLITSTGSVGGVDKTLQLQFNAL